MTKALYEFHWDCGCMDSIEGRFFATHEEVKACIGKKVYFGDVDGILEEEDLRVLTDDASFLALAEKLGINLSSGYNPLEYLEEDM